jgi:L-ascorbate metabolism protein UlaG (beta-lactamase superfamily)
MSLLRPAERKDGRYLNPVPTKVGGFSTMLKVLPQYLSNREEVEPRQPLGPFRTDASLYATPPASGLRVTWFGHSSLLIEIDGRRVLIDPVWEQRASPFQWMGPRRFFAPTLELATLPPLDAVLISHDHYDHLGEHTVRALAQLQPQARWITSLGVGHHLRQFGVSAERITELNWTESVGDEQLRITAWPSRHFSGRWLHDRFRTLWGSFVIEGPQHRVFYGADSGHWPGFAEIAAQYDGFDLTMLEIGASNVLWESIHLGPDRALEAFQSMGDRGGLLMPIHWGLFNLALHGWRQPIERIVEIAAAQSVPLWLTEPGVPNEVVAPTPRASAWWRVR